MVKTLGRKKKYLRSSISFGEPDDPARIFVEDFIEKHGKRKLSPFIRRLIASQTPRTRKDLLKKKEKELLQQIQNIGKALHSVRDELEELEGKHEDSRN